MNEVRLRDAEGVVIRLPHSLARIASRFLERHKQLFGGTGDADGVGGIWRKPETPPRNPNRLARIAAAAGFVQVRLRSPKALGGCLHAHAV